MMGSVTRVAGLLLTPGRNLADVPGTDWLPVIWGGDREDEAHAPFASGKQKGSSAMPHKRNPITCERITGLARVLRGNAQAAVENVALWHERDISHSSVERVIVPDSFLALDHMLKRFTEIVKGLTVDRARMRRNLEAGRGLGLARVQLGDRF